MIRRWLALLLSLLLLSGMGRAEIQWKTDTPAQQQIQSYIEQVNTILTTAGELPVNRLFEMYQSFAVLGMTLTDDAETPEGVEITVKLFYDSIDSLELRMTDPERFPRVAGAFLCGLSPETLLLEDTMKQPAQIAQRAISRPEQSYEEEIEPLNGTVPRAYYAYYPNQYQDGQAWIQMTIIFPMEWNGFSEFILNSPAETRAPDTWSDHDPTYEGYFSEDPYSHLDVFATATPEPDSAAKEYDPYYR